MFLFSCAYAYAYVACVMLIAQVGTRLKRATLDASCCLKGRYVMSFSYSGFLLFVFVT